MTSSTLVGLSLMVVLVERLRGRDTLGERVWKLWLNSASCKKYLFDRTRQSGRGWRDRGSGRERSSSEGHTQHGAQCKAQSPDPRGYDLS